MTVQDPAEMDRCAAVFAVAAYVIANLPQRLPRDGDYPTVDVEPDGAALVTSQVVMIMVCLTFALLFAKRNH